MGQPIREIMTRSPACLDVGTTVAAAAQTMKEKGIGDVVVTEDDQVYGLVTDRDLVVRVLADGHDPNTALRDVCSHDLVFLAPDDDVDRAVELVRSQAVRRIPVVDHGTPVGIVSIGDLAMERDPHSALADISAARANT
jgi:CBS domain-containing protein